MTNHPTRLVGEASQLNKLNEWWGFLSSLISASQRRRKGKKKRERERVKTSWEKKKQPRDSLNFEGKPSMLEMSVKMMY